MSNEVSVFGDLSKPATHLIEKISEAIGGLYKPHQMKRVAQAEIAIEKMKAEAKVEIAEIEQRALDRLVQKAVREQKVIDAVIKDAIPQLQENAQPQNIDDDWLANFFDKSRLTSDSQIQKVWSKILSGEANSPGSFAKRTVNVLSNMDKRDADLFTKVCATCWNIDKLTPLVYNYEDPIYNQNGINFDTLKHLDDIGLVNLEALGKFKKMQMPQFLQVSYFENNFTLKLPKDEKNELIIGSILFTNVGQELSLVCTPESIYGFIEFVRKVLEARSCELIQI